MNVDKKKIFRDFKTPSNLITLFPLAMGSLFFIGLFPGRLVRDTIGNIAGAITGVYSKLYPPSIEAVISLLLFFDKSLAPLFFVQIFAYWFSVFLLSRYFLSKSIYLSILVLIISIYPYNIHWHSTLIKDVWLQSSYLMFFGLISYSISKPNAKLTVAVIIFLQGMITVLTRSNFIALIPPIAIAISWAILSPQYNKKYFVRLILTSFMIGTFIWAMNNKIQFFLTEGRIKEVNHFTRLAAQELIGMSIRSGHKGVTKSLSGKAKARINKTYYGTTIFLTNGLGVEGLELRNKLRKSNETVKLWKNQILSDPVLYLKHRWHIFSKLYDGTGQSHTSNLRKNQKKIPKKYAKIMNSIQLDSIRPTVVWKIYEKYIIEYFSLVKTHWWILIYSFVAFFYILYRIIKFRDFHNCLIICTLIILCAWSYTLPYLFMLPHAEVRYVYPSNALILFSVPFLVSYNISKSKVSTIE